MGLGGRAFQAVEPGSAGLKLPGKIRGTQLNSNFRQTTNGFLVRVGHKCCILYLLSLAMLVQTPIPS